MNEQQSIERLARIETNIAAMAETLKRIADDHEKRLRTLENNSERLQAIVKLVMWLGAPGTAAVVLFLASKWN